MPEIIVCNKIYTVDDIDYDYLAQFTWAIATRGHALRCLCVNGIRITIYMHKEIADRMGLKGQIDHKDRDVSNNRRKNLREATGTQNQANKGLLKNNTSGYKGVTYCRKRWIAQLGYKNSMIHLGCFNAPEKAARAYDRAAKIYYGEFAVLNFE